MDDWIELAFEGTIDDGPGADLILDARRTGDLPRVWITDGAERQVLLPDPLSQPTAGGFNYNGYDLSGLELDFQPIAVRIQGSDNAPPAGGLQLWLVKARISQ